MPPEPAGEQLAAARVAIARRCIEAMNARDFDAYFACLTPDFVLATAPGTPGGQVVVGPTDLMRFFAGFLDAWDNVRYEFLEGPQPLGERLVSRDRWIGRDRETGAERSIEFHSVATFRGTRVCRVEMFGDRESALQCARGTDVNRSA